MISHGPFCSFGCLTQHLVIARSEATKHLLCRAMDRFACARNDNLHFGRIASAVPWMKAWIFTTSASVSLPVKSGMP